MRSRARPNPIPANVRAARQRLGLTQEQLAQRARVSTGTVARLEQGITKRPRDDEFDRIAAALGTTTEELEHPSDSGASPVPSPGVDSNGPQTLHFSEMRNLVGQIERELGTDEPELAEALITSLRASLAMVKRAKGAGDGGTRG